jgi:heme/copper-type cytochrome/quinol oxidase subunit 3
VELLTKEQDFDDIVLLLGEFSQLSVYFFGAFSGFTFFTFYRQTCTHGLHITDSFIKMMVFNRQLFRLSQMGRQIINLKVVYIKNIK